MDDGDELRITRKPEGTERFSSKGSPGYDRDVAFNPKTKKVAGPTESRPLTGEDRERIKDDLNLVEPWEVHLDPSPREQTIGGEIGQVFADAFRELAHDPEFRATVGQLVTLTLDRARERSAPAVAALRSRFGKRKASAPLEPAESPGPAPSDVVDLEPVERMTEAEYRESVVLLAAVDQFRTDLRAKLGRAEIVDAEPQPPEVEAAVQSMLEGDYTTLDADAQALLAAWFSSADPAPAEFGADPVARD